MVPAPGCRKGYLELAAGRDAEPVAAQARALLQELDTETRAGVLEHVERLEARIAAARQGAEPWHGELPESLPAALRDWLQQHGRRHRAGAAGP